MQWNLLQTPLIVDPIIMVALQWLLHIHKSFNLFLNALCLKEAKTLNFLITQKPMVHVGSGFISLVSLIRSASYHKKALL